MFCPTPTSECCPVTPMMIPYTFPSVPITIPPDEPSKISASMKTISLHAGEGADSPKVWWVLVILPTVAVSWKPSGDPITATISPTSTDFSNNKIIF